VFPVRRTLAAALLPLLLVLTGCGDNPEEGVTAKKATIADIQVTGEPGKKPVVDFKPPVTFATTQSKVLDKGPGKGDEIAENSEVTVNYLGINAADGSEFGSTYDKGDQPAIFTVNQVIPGFGKGLQGAQAGDRVLITVTPEDAYGESGNGSDIGKNTSVIFVVDVLKVKNPAKPVTLTEKDIPKLELDKDGNPTKFVTTPGIPDSVSKLGVAVLKEGKGAKVTSNDTLTVNYLGQIYPDGKVFDESYSTGQPATFPLSNVIAGWQQGLVGQREGSRVVLVIPSELGYGATGQGKDIPPDSDLIFVVDIEKIG
jgi:peptidylprolyl isomerase